MDEFDFELESDSLTPEQQIIAEETAAERRTQMDRLPAALASLSDKHRAVV